MHSSSIAVPIRRVLAPKVPLPHGYEQAKIYVWKLVALVVSWVVILGAFLYAVVFLAEPPLNFSIMMTLLMVTAVLWVFWIVSIGLRMVMNGVRVSGRGPLQFVPRGYVGSLSILMGICLFSAGLIVVLSWFGVGGAVITGPIGRYGGGIATLLGGIAFLAYLGVKAATPAGITVEADGVSWWAGVTEYWLQWEDISGAAVQVQAKGRKGLLYITEVDGRQHKLYPVLFGSDPYFVAEIIQHFLEVPADRARLTDPLAAIALVAAIEI